MSKKLKIGLSTLLVGVLAGVFFGVLNWENESYAGLLNKEIKQFEKTVKDMKLPAAARLSDKELLALLASAPLAPPEAKDDMNTNKVTHYSDNQAKIHERNTYTNNASSVDVGCGKRGDDSKVAKPLIVDVNNDGIRDVVSLVRSNNCTASGTLYFNFLRRIVVYTPTEDGKELRVLAYTHDKLPPFNEIYDSSSSSYGWHFKTKNIPDGTIDKNALKPASEPILGFENGRISAKMIRTVSANSPDNPLAEVAENYTVFFEIQDENLVVAEKQRMTKLGSTGN